MRRRAKSEPFARKRASIFLPGLPGTPWRSPGTLEEVWDTMGPLLRNAQMLENVMENVLADPGAGVSQHPDVGKCNGKRVG